MIIMGQTSYKRETSGGETGEWTHSYVLNYRFQNIGRTFFFSFFFL